MPGKREYGDYQTPEAFAERVCRYLRDVRHVAPSAVVEPTCGVGHFLRSSLMLQAGEYYGIEINPAYCGICRRSVEDSRVTVINADIFRFSTRALIKDSRQILVLGNPPWAVSSTLSVLGSDNLPVKGNFKGLRGLDAMTGAGTFDICESIILQLLREYSGTNTVLAMLCKTAVARNVFAELKRTRTPFSACDLLTFDAGRVFGVSVSACLLVVELSESGVSADACRVFDFDRPETPLSRFGYDAALRRCSREPADAERFDGRCCFEWRQGVKHDCAGVMELTLRDGVLRNGLREEVRIEDALVFPLVKSSMFKAPVIRHFSRYVIVTQKRIREDTGHLERDFPRAWQYLSAHLPQFEGRKSAIYRGAPPFSMFGVGDYSYARYKVGVSGFYKQPRFSLLCAESGQPVMTDDTSYFICFDSYDPAYTAMLLLNHGSVQRFLTGITFPDAKRPFTKKVLERIDFGKITAALSIEDLTDTEQHLALPPYITPAIYEEFRLLTEGGQLRLAL